MYQQSDIALLTQQIKKRWIITLIPVVLFLAVALWGFLPDVRLEAVSAGGIIGAGTVLLFSYDMFLKPLRCYRRHIEGCLHGRTHTLDCRFLHMDADVSMVDHVAYHAVTVEVDGEDGKVHERLFYADIQKPFPALEKRASVRILYHDREIAGIEVL